MLCASPATCGNVELETQVVQACKGISGDAHKAMSSTEASGGAGTGQLPASGSAAPGLDEAELDHAIAARYEPSDQRCCLQLRGGHSCKMYSSAACIALLSVGGPKLRSARRFPSHAVPS